MPCHGVAVRINEMVQIMHLVESHSLKSSTGQKLENVPAEMFNDGTESPVPSLVRSKSYPTHVVFVLKP